MLYCCRLLESVISNMKFSYYLHTYVHIDRFESLAAAAGSLLTNLFYLQPFFCRYMVCALSAQGCAHCVCFVHCFCSRVWSLCMLCALCLLVCVLTVCFVHRVCLLCMFCALHVSAHRCAHCVHVLTRILARRGEMLRTANVSYVNAHTP